MTDTGYPRGNPQTGQHHDWNGRFSFSKTERL